MRFFHIKHNVVPACSLPSREPNARQTGMQAGNSTREIDRRAQSACALAPRCLVTELSLAGFGERLYCVVTHHALSGTYRMRSSWPSFRWRWACSLSQQLVSLPLLAICGQRVLPSGMSSLTGVSPLHRIVFCVDALD